MNLETRARGAAAGLRTMTPVDVEDGLQRLRRTRRRRTTGKIMAVILVVVVAVGVVQLQRDHGRAVQPISPHGQWVLVSGSGVDADGRPVQGKGGEWAESLVRKGTQTYPTFMSADPATRRFLVSTDPEGSGLNVMTPGRRAPLLTFDCNSLGCDGAILGPGPDEVTMGLYSGRIGPLPPGELVVFGPDGRPLRNLGPVEGRSLAWSPRGQVWAEARYYRRDREASVAVVLRRPNSSVVTTLYEHAEPAPPWYEGAGAFQLAWAPASTRLAFVALTTSALAHQSEGDRNAYQWRLFLGDADTGKVDQVADLGRCDRRDRGAASCGSHAPSLAWTPDGQSLTVLANAHLTRYDLDGTVLESEPTDLKGPIAWVESR